MKSYKIFYKSKTFFLYLFFLCIIPSANVYSAGNKKQKSDSLSFGAEDPYCLWIASASSKYPITSEDSFLFVFDHRKNFDKHTKYSFKIEKNVGADGQNIDKPIFDWSEWSHQNERKYLLPSGNYTVSVKIISDSLPEQLVGHFPVTVAQTQTEKQSNIPRWWLVVAVVFIIGIIGILDRKKSKGKPVPLSDADKQDRNDIPAPVSASELSKKHEKYLEEEKPFFQKYHTVTVLFADIEGFSEITDSMVPEVLLEELNSFFFHFDTVVDRYRIEKIKTMGDAYMCAGGLPQKNCTNPVEVVLAATEVRDHLNKLRERNPNVWMVRTGIHTGEVMAGMLGHKKLSYDIWGHTVNVAARMESSCEAGKIHISKTTYELVADFFDCENAGARAGKPDIASYYVIDLKPEFSDRDADGRCVPNRAFEIRLQLLRLHDLEEYAENEIKPRSSDLLFHNFKHTRDVYEHVELFGRSENISAEEMLLLRTAALFHDIGYTVSHNNAAAESEAIAREMLPLFRYDAQQIDTICRLMQASHYESEPTNILEQIIHDANLIFYGRADFIACVINRFHEWQKYGPGIEKSKLLQMQIEQLSKHRFYTRAAEKIVSVSAEQQIAQTKKLKNNDSKDR